MHAQTPLRESPLKVRILRFFLVIVGLFRSVHAEAAHENGNGGDVVYCSHPDRPTFEYNQTIFLLDYIEGEKLRGLVFDGPRPDLAVAKTRTLPELRQLVLDLFVERISQFDLELADGYAQRLATFFDEALILEMDLSPVDDSLHVGLPPHCRVQQAAVQKEPFFPEDRRYLISGLVWPAEYVSEPCQADFCIPLPDFLTQNIRIDKATFQAGLMIHEVILRRAIKLGQEDSVKVRYFNSTVMSKNFPTMDEAAWLELRRLTGL